MTNEKFFDNERYESAKLISNVASQLANKSTDKIVLLIVN